MSIKTWFLGWLGCLAMMGFWVAPLNAAVGPAQSESAKYLLEDSQSMLLAQSDSNQGRFGDRREEFEERRENRREKLEKKREAREERMRGKREARQEKLEKKKEKREKKKNRKKNRKKKFD